MTQHEKLVWLAGFFEGEGSISIHQDINALPRFQIHGNIMLSQRSLELLKAIVAQVVELGLPAPRWCTRSLQLGWNGYKGAEFLQALRPYFRHPYKILYADLYLSLFAPTKKGLHSPERRSEKEAGYKEWKHFRGQQQEENREVRESYGLLTPKEIYSV